MKKIEKSIDLNASPDKVWKVLTADQYVRQWYVPFSEGSYAETDNWKEGTKVVFTDGSGSGMIAHVVENIPNTSLVVEFDGMQMNNVEDYDSKDARDFKGQKEAYRLIPNGNSTRLEVEAAMTEEMHEQMSGVWDKALQVIKRLSES